jgi:hypothetical protein
MQRTNFLVCCEHWAKKVSVNPEFWAIRNWERPQWSPFVCGLLALLASETKYLVMFDVLPHLRPEVGGGDFKVSFVSRIVSSKDAVLGLAHSFLSVPRW